MYAKWEEWSKNVQEEEKQEELLDLEYRNSILKKEQEEKKKKYIEKYGVEPPQSSCCGQNLHKGNEHL